MTVRFALEAEEELVATARWYEARRAGLGVELLAEVDRAVNAIAEAPQSYAFWRKDRPYRKCVLRRFPFVVFFTHDVGDVFVIAVAHARRRPEYWTRR